MLIIDGHNLIGRSGDLKLDREEESREELLRRIAARKGRSGEPVLVVFDGNRPEKKGAGSFGGVRVAFSSNGKTADEEILNRIDKQKTGQVTVVTSDRELAGRARARGAKIEPAEAFWQRLQKPLGGGAAAEQKPAPTPAETERWLEIFGKRNPAKQHKI